MALAPSFYASTTSGVGGYLKGLITGGLAGALAGAVVGAVIAGLTGGFSLAAMLPAAQMGAMYGGAIMAAVGSVAGTVTGVVSTARAAYPPPTPDDVLKIAREAHEQGVQVGHHIAMTQQSLAEQHRKPSFRERIMRERSAQTQGQQIH